MVGAHVNMEPCKSIWRCPACQIAVFSQYTTPRLRFVRAGTLDDPSSVAPDVHIYTRSKLPWVELPESVPAYRTYYDSTCMTVLFYPTRTVLPTYLVAVACGVFVGLKLHFLPFFKKILPRYKN